MHSINFSLDRSKDSVEGDARIDLEFDLDYTSSVAIRVVDDQGFNESMVSALILMLHVAEKGALSHQSDSIRWLNYHDSSCPVASDVGNFPVLDVSLSLPNLLLPISWYNFVSLGFLDRWLRIQDCWSNMAAKLL